MKCCIKLLELDVKKIPEGEHLNDISLGLEHCFRPTLCSTKSRFETTFTYQFFIFDPMVALRSAESTIWVVLAPPSRDIFGVGGIAKRKQFNLVACVT